MPKLYYSVLTSYGSQAFARAMASRQPLNITTFAVGDGNGRAVQPDSQRTSLVREVYRANVSAISLDPRNPRQVIFELTIPENVGGFWIREMGIFDNQNRLVAYANCPDSFKPQLESGSGKVQVLRMILLVSSSDAVTLTVDDSVIFAKRGELTPQTITATSQNSVDQTGHSHAIDHASTSRKGVVQLTNDTGLDSESLALTAKAGKKLSQEIAQNRINTTNLANQKVDKSAISDSVSSTSQTTVASSRAVKTAYDKGVEGLNKANEVDRNALKKTGFQHLIGTLRISPPMPDNWTAFQLGTKEGYWQFEANPNSQNENDRRLNLVYRGNDGLTQAYLQFRSIENGQFVAYESWVKEQIANIPKLNAVQQGGGEGQLTNKVMIGWSGERLKGQVDNVDLGNFVFEGQFDLLKTAFEDFVNGRSYVKKIGNNHNIQLSWEDDGLNLKVDEHPLGVIVTNRYRASTSQFGIVQLTNDTGLDSENLAFSAKGAKILAQQIAQVRLLASGKQSPATTLDGYGITNAVQQGGGSGQRNNKVMIGWSGSRLKGQVDNVDLGNFVFEGHLNLVQQAIDNFINSKDYIKRIGNPHNIQLSWQSSGLNLKVDNVELGVIATNRNLSSWVNRRDYNRTVSFSGNSVRVTGQVIAYPDGRIEQIFHVRSFRANWLGQETAGTGGYTGEREFNMAVQLWTAMPNKITKVHSQTIRAVDGASQTFSAEAGEWQTGWQLFNNTNERGWVNINFCRLKGNSNEPIDLYLTVEGY